VLVFVLVLVFVTALVLLARGLNLTRSLVFVMSLAALRCNQLVPLEAGGNTRQRASHE